MAVPRLLLLTLILCTLAAPLHGQDETITRNPACVQLKRVWTLEGTVPDEMVGAGVGSAGDVNGDGIGDFAVFANLPNRWMVFYGARDTISSEPAWTMDSGNYVITPVVGDFWGSGHHAIGFLRSWLVLQTGRQYDWIRIFRSDSNRLEEAPSAIWQSVDWRDTTRRSSVSDVLAVDLDGDGDDELICVMASVYGDRHGELWIYDGGADFQVDTPSVVLRDPELNDGFLRAFAGDIDGDRRIDLMTIKRATDGTVGNFYWGLIRSGQLPDRSVVIGNPSADYSQFTSLADCDGDQVQDLVRPETLIWRSGSGKNPRTRDWDAADADIYLLSAGGPFGPGGRPGYLNSKRYEMIATAWSPGKIYFSGGPEGPDLAYDAMFYPGNDGLQGSIGRQSPAGDINGDGWDDAISGNRAYPDDRTSAGIAVILAGGPYIPSDDPTVGVRQLPLENKTNALSLWPNPVRDELNIAWRGDLTRMPRRFAIHDMLGQLVASGAVPDGDGAAVWRCAGVPAGAYLLSIFDSSEKLLGTTRFLKY